MKLKKQRKMIRELAANAAETAIRPMFARMCKCPIFDRVLFAWHLLCGNEDLDVAQARSARLRKILMKGR